MNHTDHSGQGMHRCLSLVAPLGMVSSFVAIEFRVSDMSDQD